MDSEGAAPPVSIQGSGAGHSGAALEASDVGQVEEALADADGGAPNMEKPALKAGTLYIPGNVGWG
jgi:hypothetical protein